MRLTLFCDVKGIPSKVIQCVTSYFQESAVVQTKEYAHYPRATLQMALARSDMLSARCDVLGTKHSGILLCVKMCTETY